MTTIEAAYGRVRTSGARLLGCLSLLLLATNTVPGATDCSDFPQNADPSCCITSWGGNQSCSRDNPDVDANGRTADGHNLSACLESQCNPYCGRFGGTYPDAHAVQRPLMRWDRELRSCACQIVDEGDPNANPELPSACRVPVDEGLVINEYRAVVLRVRPGPPDFVELYNSSNRTVDLGRYTVANWVSSFGSPFATTLPLPHVAVHPGDFFTICDGGSPVINCDLPGVERLFLSDTNSAGSRSLELLRQFHVADAATYSGAVPPWPHGEGSGTVPALGAETSAGRSRLPDGADTDDTLADTSIRCMTPGLPNVSTQTPCPPPLNHAPRAHAASLTYIACTSSAGADVVLDGSSSTDADSTVGTNDDIASFQWFEGGVLLGTGPVVSAQLSLGAHQVLLTVVDRSGARDSDEVQATIVDTAPPLGRITSPSNGACFGPAELPVVVGDDFKDACDPNLTRTYTPGPGPSYDSHGDHTVSLAVTDSSGNQSLEPATVAFTIDARPPIVSIRSLVGGTSPATLPLALVFTATDDDGADGGVVHEVIKLQDRPGGVYCTIYDGLTYGDGDGLLSDESLQITQQDLCRVTQSCGFAALNQPAFLVEATDCGGNVGGDVRRVVANMQLRPGVCDSLKGGYRRQAIPLVRFK